MSQVFSEVENTDPEHHQRWLDKHGFKPGEDGKFQVDDYKGKIPVSVDQLLANIRTNVSAGGWEPLFELPYDDRTFVMVCGGPSLANHLDEIKAKSLDPSYAVVCSNMTGAYLREHGITPFAHFIIDPQERKKFDVRNASKDIQYWINAACDPAVFLALKDQGITPHIFLADFDAEGKARAAVKESLPPGKPGMMAIQGGTMAGLRAMNIADALGFRSMEYYGFDATVKVENGEVSPYAYYKPRGETVIEVTCQECEATFDTTLVFQKQVNEFVQWRHNMPWMDVKIIGGGLISHHWSHVEALQANKVRAKHRFTREYAELQKVLHAEGDYGVAGQQYMPIIFHGVSQLAKRLGSVSVLDYGSAQGNTMRKVRDVMWLPPTVTDRCYDPFIEGKDANPEAADFVICTDVLEHVEPECTWAVLDHIQSLTRQVAFFAISLVPAKKILADGRNAHINLRDPEFWMREIKKRFIPGEVKLYGNGELLVIAQSIEAVKAKMKEANERLAA